MKEGKSKERDVLIEGVNTGLSMVLEKFSRLLQDDTKLMHRDMY